MEKGQEQTYKVTHEFYIAGVKFHQLRNVIDDLSEGDNLFLTPEPSNKFDPNAIKIESARPLESMYHTMLGYVPKRFSSEISAMLDVGKVLECVLVKLDKSAKTWEQAKVEVREIIDV